MSKVKELPNIEYLLECFRYNPETGILYWRERPLHHFTIKGNYVKFNKNCANKEAGYVGERNYLLVTLDGGTYKIHRLIWKIVHNREPGDTIDHINGITNDNRIVNLREATFLENSRNQTKISKSNSSGYPGVHWHKRDERWVARINLDGKRKNLGYFNTAEEASEAREKAAKEHYGEFYTKLV